MRENSEIWEDIEKKKIAINIYISKPSLDNKYFYVETQKELLNMLNKKNFIKIPNLQN